MSPARWFDHESNGTANRFVFTYFTNSPVVIATNQMMTVTMVFSMTNLDGDIITNTLLVYASGCWITRRHQGCRLTANREF